MAGPFSMTFHSFIQHIIMYFQIGLACDPVQYGSYGYKAKSKIDHESESSLLHLINLQQALLRHPTSFNSAYL